jgi:hypothetical protein
VTSLTAVSRPRPSWPDGGRQRHDGRPAAPRRTAGREFLVARGMRAAQGKKVADRRLRDRGRRAPASASRRLIRQHQAAEERWSQAVKESLGSGAFVSDDGSFQHNRQPLSCRQSSLPVRTIKRQRLAPMRGASTRSNTVLTRPQGTSTRSGTAHPCLSRRRSERVFRQRGDQCVRRSEPAAGQRAGSPLPRVQAFSRRPPPGCRRSCGRRGRESQKTAPKQAHQPACTAQHG